MKGGLFCFMQSYRRSPNSEQPPSHSRLPVMMSHNNNILCFDCKGVSISEFGNRAKFKTSSNLQPS